MLDQGTRTTILTLHEEGHGVRTIAQLLGISKGAVKRVLRSQSAEVPRLERAEVAETHHARILELLRPCKGNLVRVHEELCATGAEFSYQALTAYCRRHGIGHTPAAPAGHYDFEPGQEMQHDTSPHVAEIGGRRVRVQTASLVLCHSRMRYVQMYPRFTRFECKLFLTDAIRYFEGSCERCMIDNTHVVVLSGTGRDMVPSPVMAAFAERFGFEFRAHAVGDANRSAHVERTFDYVENNFLAGRTFADWKDLNTQAHAWCDRVNATHRRHLHASARELFATEVTRLRPLPAHIPEVYRLHQRMVDTEGYINLQRTRYSAPWQLMGRQLEVRELRDRVELYDGPRRVAEHPRRPDAPDMRITDPAHRPPRSEGVWARKRLSREEQLVREKLARGDEYVALLRRRGRGSLRDLRWLSRLLTEYPREALSAALDEALRYGMADLERLERMTLRRIARDFFVMTGSTPAEPEDGR
jgi:predicted transcriptional regulator